MRRACLVGRLENGPNSIELGTKWLQSLNHIFIDPVRTPNAWREFTSAEYKRDKFGNVTSKLPDTENHVQDSCLTGDTLVSVFDDGNTGTYKVVQKPISSLVGTSGLLPSFDTKTDLGKIRASKFGNVRKTKSMVAVYKITLVDGRTFEATIDHPVLTRRGWVRVGDLTENDEILDYNDILSKSSAVKVKSVVFSRYADVYNMEVDETHNFLINNGLVVHNCRYACEDYWNNLKLVQSSKNIVF